LQKRAPSAFSVEQLGQTITGESVRLSAAGFYVIRLRDQLGGRRGLINEAPFAERYTEGRNRTKYAFRSMFSSENRC
jgi:hypothetical protein